MKVTDIQVDGFGVWTGLSVDSLPDGMTLFYGPNEAGKTTLMQFLRAVLYGFTDDRRERYLPPVHGGTPGGAIRVTGPGGGYEIRRHSQLTDSGPAGRLTVTGYDGLVQGQHRLSMLLGQIDESIFTNVFAIGIRELQELSTLDDTAAADELYKLSSGLDRVSLVDVMRSLREGRQDLVGRGGGDDGGDAAKLAGLLASRQRLRDEVEQLTRSGRRWGELATQRRLQQQEIEQLSGRLDSCEHESRCVEVATNVFETWTQREALEQRIAETETQAQLPDDAPGKLVQLDAALDERRKKLEDVKRQRREIRDKAEQLPLSRRLLELQGRIEAATEQATWVEALEEQIARLDDQIAKARQQLDADAQRLGLDDADTRALAEGDTNHLPDLSKQTLAALAGPAKNVKEQLFQLKQARGEGIAHKEKADKLGRRMAETLDRTRADNLQQAIRDETELIARLRHRIQLGEHLEKLKRHYRDLERESVDLATDRVLPIDRLPMLSIPFIFGGGLVLYGLFHVFNVETFIGQTANPTQGMLCVIFGAMALLVYYLYRERGQRATSLDLEDCERQIDTLRRQIREIESERDDLDAALPASGESLAQRLRDSEALLADLEAALPVYHQHQAAVQAHQSARQRATKAAEDLKEARRQWSDTLGRLGLSETMSPSSVRNLSDGYETLQSNLRRLTDLKQERDQRRRERQAIAKRIETLYLEALDAGEASARDSATEDRQTGGRERPSGGQFKSRTGPLDQLNHLHEELARQQHWIKRRRELKEQDQQLKKQQSIHTRAIERTEQQRRALWAKCGVATAEQFYALVDTQARLSEMRAEHEELDQRVRSMIGTHVDYDEVAREIDGAAASDLERRWESLTSRMTEIESRIAQLRTSQGELAQEMKQLADDNRLMTARLELGCVERKIETLARRWQTYAMASCLLEEVCQTFERERQPETLREASSFLGQLTGGKYTRIWTPLGTNRLKIDDADGNSLSLELLSRGTGEAVFIALRLALAAAYARRGVMLPLVLDDVLVNFDRTRAEHAAETLRTFSELGHQVMMFTCHEHMVEIFQSIGVEVRQLPEQGQPGRATVLPAEPKAADLPDVSVPAGVEVDHDGTNDEIEMPLADAEPEESAPAEAESESEPESEPTRIRYIRRTLRRHPPVAPPPEPQPAPAPASQPAAVSRPAEPARAAPAPRKPRQNAAGRVDRLGLVRTRAG